MCAPTPKAPKVEKVPERAASVLPNGGDPSIRAGDRNRRRGLWSPAALAQAATLGSPSTSAPLGMTGNG